MNISYDKKNHTYKFGDVVLSKKEFIKYIDDDMLQACISNCPVNIECAEANDTEIIENEYHRAAKTLLDYINEYSLELDSCADSVNAVLKELNEKYSPEKLGSLSDDEILTTMFYSSKSDNSSLCYFLEHNTNSKDLFGSISGGSSYKFKLFQNHDDNEWTTGSSRKPEKLTYRQALELGKILRDYLIKGAEIIQNAELSSPEDYEKLNLKLNEATKNNCDSAWMHKYFSMLFPDKLAPFHSSDWQHHILYALRIKPSESLYGRDGQISYVRKLTGLDNVSFCKSFIDKFGVVKTFLRLGTSNSKDEHYADSLCRDQVAGIGWNKIGDLSNYVTGNSINKTALIDALKNKYYPEKSQYSVASKKAGELISFYTASADSIFVAMDGERTLAFIDDIKENYFTSEKPLGHRRQGNWHISFDSDEKLPITEGLQTSCTKIKNKENLIYLYEKYYYGSEKGDVKNMNMDRPFTAPVYNTGLKTIFPLNRIIFGAPGTGKSYGLECDKKKLLQEDESNPKIHIGDYERVTFHPDYTYSQFVGTYKPVSIGNEVYYKFVPGPFIRILVKAIENGKTDNPQPYILLIEEINRAPVAAVFGDIFQLLDRNENGSSQYEIESSEDVRRYLADMLGGEPSDYEKIKIPNNMYIWATMNSADQGVCPMDTAFKRRWDFTYLGVDENDHEIREKYVEVGDQKERIEWNSLRKAINEWLSKEKINEDKQLGPYFISRSIVVPENGGTEIDSERFKETFKNKVLMYLFEDAARQRRNKLFDQKDGINTNRYSELCSAFDKYGINIFNEEIQSKVLGNSSSAFTDREEESV